MNGKIAKLLRRWALELNGGQPITKSEARASKNLWKKTPRNKRYALHVNICKQLGPEPKPLIATMAKIA